MFPIRTATSRTVAESLQNNQIQAVENEKTSMVERPGESDWDEQRRSYTLSIHLCFLSSVLQVLITNYLHA
jgi:hypothetical protein